MMMVVTIQTEQLNKLAVSDVHDSGQPLTCPPHMKVKRKKSKTKHVPPPHNTQMLHMWPKYFSYHGH